LLTLLRVPTGIGKFWKVMEIDTAIFQGLNRFGNGKGKVLDSCLVKVLKYPKMDIT